MLFQPEAHEPLTDEAWDEGRVRDGVRAIVADADQAFDPDTLWPAHDWDRWTLPLPLTDLYAGAAGVVWALDELRRRGHAESRLDLAAAARLTLEAWRENPSLPSDVELPAKADTGLVFGESGVLLVAWRLAPDPRLAEDLLARVLENTDNQTNELMWGASGTMLAARAMLGWTGEQRWADAWRESASELLSQRESDGLWTQHLYTRDYRGLGPAHGLVGNVAALVQGGDLLPDGHAEALARETAAVLGRTAVIEDDLANWPPDAGDELRNSRGEIRVQWCHGAPGIVVSAAPYLDEELLLAGAELTWRAGPTSQEKGAGICHGTAGNGYAFLKAFERTGDELWLERGRRFAVHALGQVERARAADGQGRYSLWTGDVGVALYAADCLDGRAAYPIVDSWDW